MADCSDSIHYRRRWFYALWCLLLAASIIAMILWQIPVRSGKAKLRLQMHVKGAPLGCKVFTWSGPSERWPSTGLPRPEGSPGQELSADGVVVAGLTLPVAYRRWVGNYILDKTADLAVLTFHPAEGPDRYFLLPLSRDWNTGVLKPGGKMRITVGCSWKYLGAGGPVRPQ